MFKILLVDDETISREMLATYIEGLLGFEVVQVASGEEALIYFENNECPIIISDIKMPGMNGIQLLREINSVEKGRHTKVILVTGFAQIETAIEAIREGAYDYLIKPIEVHRLGEIIRNIISDLENEKIGDENNSNNIKFAQSYLNGSYLEVPGFDKVGIFSPAMRDITEMCLKLHKDRNLSVLIEGESGTGKEILATLIHSGAEKSDKPMITINCAAITPSLFESEMFGYEGGAFTGGKHGGKKGKLDLANGGTLVLDEIGEIPLELQAKLLRVIQEKSFYRVGGNQKIDIDVRFIASTNRDLQQLVKENRFRNDLFFRINTAYIKIPPLRKQKEAIAPLAQMFLVDFARQKNKKFRLIDVNAIKLLESHLWKGNIRELKNIIERIVLLYDEYELRANHLGFLGDGIESIENKIFTLRPGMFELPDDCLIIEEIEKEIVQKALNKFNGNKSQTAKYLGLTPSSLRSRLK